MLVDKIRQEVMTRADNSNDTVISRVIDFFIKNTPNNLYDEDVRKMLQNVADVLDEEGKQKIPNIFRLKGVLYFLKENIDKFSDGNINGYFRYLISWVERQIAEHTNPFNEAGMYPLLQPYTDCGFDDLEEYNWDSQIKYHGELINSYKMYVHSDERKSW